MYCWSLILGERPSSLLDGKLSLPSWKWQQTEVRSWRHITIQDGNKETEHWFKRSSFVTLSGFAPNVTKVDFTAGGPASPKQAIASVAAKRTCQFLSRRPCSSKRLAFQPFSIRKCQWMPVIKLSNPQHLKMFKRRKTRRTKHHGDGIRLCYDLGSFRGAHRAQGSYCSTLVTDLLLIHIEFIES